jgi:predicted metal-dependent hydrolase
MKYWCENSAVLTHYYNGLSILFPAWEQLFCKVIEAYKPKVDDAELLVEMDKFIKQEKAHTKAHHAHNLSIGDAHLEGSQYARAEALAKKPASGTVLGAMVSIEHMASSAARDLIDRYEHEKGKEYKMFVWHAREEIEHKSVAFRLWKYFKKDRSFLKRIAVVNFKGTVLFGLNYMWKKLKEEKLLWKPKTWYDMTRLMYRVVFKMLLPYSCIFRNDFDPDKIDDSKYVLVRHTTA